MALKRSNLKLDSPVNNFATLNPLVVSDVDYSDGNLTHRMKAWVGTAPGWYSKSTMSIPVGKFYWECLYSPASKDNPGWGILHGEDSGSNNPLTSGTASSTGDIVSFWPANDNSNRYYKNGTQIADKTGENFGVGEIGMCCVEMQANGIGKIWFGARGVWFNGGDPSNSSNEITTFSGTVFPAFDSPAGAGAVWIINFGQNPTFSCKLATYETYHQHYGVNGSPAYASDANGRGEFYYKPPWGALALCSANLPAAMDETPNQNFKAVTYVGTEPDEQTVSVGFQPDLIWIKDRDDDQVHILSDSVRGITNYLIPNITNPSTNMSGGVADNLVKSTSATEFTIGSDGAVNRDTNKFIAWCWKAGGTPDDTNNVMIDGVGSTLADSGLDTGDIQPTAMSVNTQAGFSIVKYPGGNAENTIPHGLNKAPEMVIVKNITSSANGSAGAHWVVRHQAIGMTGSGAECQMYMSLTAGSSANDHGTIITNGNDLLEIKESVNSIKYFHVGESGQEYIAYCWHSVPGYSAFGSYTAGETFVHTGFKPAFLMVKQATGSTNNYSSWTIIDSTRDTDNPANNPLYANDTKAEGFRAGDSNTIGNNADIDLLSNGFKVHNRSSGETSAPGTTYIYMAFAEKPPTVPAKVKYEVSSEPRHSLYFENGNYLERTFGTPSNQGVWSLSFWIKKMDLSRSFILGAFITGSRTHGVEVGDGSKNNWEIYNYDGGMQQQWNSRASGFAIDQISWHHIVLSMNYSTGNYKFFSNGKEVTSDYWPTSASNAYTSLINSSMYHTFGVEGTNKNSRFSANAGLSDANLANIHFIDGAACSADYFGKYENGKWVAKEYEGGYGNNGFHLDFAPNNMEYDSSGELELVKDSSGNGNHWTALGYY